MRKIVQPNSWSSLPCAFASIVKKDVGDVFDFLGHDGSEIIFPTLRDPFCRRGFHIQEMYSWCLWQNYCVSTFTTHIGFQPTEGHSVVYPSTRIEEYVHHYFGVFTGQLPDGSLHSIAWDGQRAMDPSDGMIKILDDFAVTQFHVTAKLT